MRSLLIFTVLLAGFVFSGCKKHPADPLVEVHVASTLSGGNVVPQVVTAASGSVTGTYNRDNFVLNITVTYTGTTATAIHLHSGAIGVTGPILQTFSNLASPATFSATLSEAQRMLLNSGEMYIDVHSAAFPTGEIRGQLLRTE